MDERLGHTHVYRTMNKGSRAMEQSPSPPINGKSIECQCGRSHKMTPTALAIALQAFIDGDAQRVMGGQIVSMCIVELVNGLAHKQRSDRVRMI